jgi:hypothetical protein
MVGGCLEMSPAAATAPAASPMSGSHQKRTSALSAEIMTEGPSPGPPVGAREVTIGRLFRPCHET